MPGDSISEEYPLGAMIEPYDIEREKEQVFEMEESNDWKPILDTGFFRKPIAKDYLLVIKSDI